MKRFVLAVVLVPLLVGAQGKDAKADPSKPQPGVNWAGQVVRATGQGAPDLKAQNPAQARLGAEMAAKADALRNLLAQVKGISVDGTRKMGDLMEKDEVRMRVEGVVRGFKITNKRYFSDSGVEIEIEVPLAMLSDVVDHGTGFSARQNGFRLPAGGKTGSTDGHADAWFIGFTPSLAAGVWIGYDRPQPIMRRGFASVVAVPVWAGFMKAATTGNKAEWMTAPAGVSRIRRCKESGGLATEYCELYGEVQDEVVASGHAPELCPLHASALVPH